MLQTPTKKRKTCDTQAADAVDNVTSPSILSSPSAVGPSSPAASAGPSTPQSKTVKVAMSISPAQKLLLKVKNELASVKPAPIKVKYEFSDITELNEFLSKTVGPKKTAERFAFTGVLLGTFHDTITTANDSIPVTRLQYEIFPIFFYDVQAHVC
jgi:hypothetical protein